MEEHMEVPAGRDLSVLRDVSIETLAERIVLLAQLAVEAKAHPELGETALAARVAQGGALAYSEDVGDECDCGFCIPGDEIAWGERVLDRWSRVSSATSDRARFIDGERAA